MRVDEPLECRVSITSKARIDGRLSTACRVARDLNLDAESLENVQRRNCDVRVELIDVTWREERHPHAHCGFAAAGGTVDDGSFFGMSCGSSRITR